MHIDRELVGHPDPDRAQRIAGAGVLPQRVIGRALGAPVDRPRIELLSLAVEDADLGPGQIAGIPLHLRDDFLLDDRDRHRPGRIEIDDRDVRRDFRRGVLGVADDRDVAVRDDAVLDRLDRGRGQIDHDIAVAELEIVDLRQPLRAGGQLGVANLRRNIDLLQGGAGDDSGLAQSHAFLEPLDRRRQLAAPDWPPGPRPAPSRPDRPRSTGACAISRPRRRWSRDATQGYRSASRPPARSPHSARRPWRSRSPCLAETSATDRLKGPSPAAAGAAAASVWAFGGVSTGIGEPGATAAAVGAGEGVDVGGAAAFAGGGATAFEAAGAGDGDRGRRGRHEDRLWRHGRGGAGRRRWRGRRGGGRNGLRRRAVHAQGETEQAADESSTQCHVFFGSVCPRALQKTLTMRGILKLHEGFLTAGRRVSGPPRP